MALGDKKGQHLLLYNFYHNIIMTGRLGPKKVDSNHFLFPAWDSLITKHRIYVLFLIHENLIWC